MTPSVRCFPSLIRLTSLMPDLADYITTQEAAGMLGFHPKSIRNMVYSKNLEAIKIGRSVLVSKKSVREYLEKTKGMNKNDPRRGKEQSLN